MRRRQIVRERTIAENSKRIEQFKKDYEPPEDTREMFKCPWCDKEFKRLGMKIHVAKTHVRNTSEPTIRNEISNS